MSQGNHMPVPTSQLQVFALNYLTFANAVLVLTLDVLGLDLQVIGLDLHILVEGRDLGPNSLAAAV